MPVTPASATPDLDAFLAQHDDLGGLPGETVDASAGAAWLCWMCWATPMAGPVTGTTGR